MFATKEIAALADDGRVTLANLNKVAAQLEIALVDLRSLIAAATAIVHNASEHGITITIKQGTTGE